MKTTPWAEPDGAGRGLLTNEQKKRLILAMQAAYKVAGAPTGETFTDWRRSELAAAVGIASLRECENRHFLPARAHFLALAGRRADATRDVLRHTQEPRTWAMHKFERTCAAVADVLPDARAYAAGFLRNTRKTTLSAASAREIWQAVFLLERRAKQLRQAARGVPAAARPGAGGGKTRQDSISAGGEAARPDMRPGVSAAFRGVPRGQISPSGRIPGGADAPAAAAERGTTHSKPI